MTCPIDALQAFSCSHNQTIQQAVRQLLSRLGSMIEPKFPSATDPKTTLQPLQFPLRHFFVLVAVCSVVTFGFTWMNRANKPNEFLTAAQAGDLTGLRQLVGSGVDIHYHDGWHTTALMMAAAHGHTECVRFLIENGADPNERARFNGTPLIWAAISGKLEIVEFLIEHGANTSLTDDDGMTAANHARQSGHNELADFIETQ